MKSYTLYQTERGRERRCADFDSANDVWALQTARLLARGHPAELRSEGRLVSTLNN